MMDLTTTQQVGLQGIGVLTALALAAIAAWKSIKTAWLAGDTADKVSDHAAAIGSLQKEAVPSNVVAAALASDPTTINQAVINGKAELNAHAAALKADISNTPVNVTVQTNAGVLAAGHADIAAEEAVNAAHS